MVRPDKVAAVEEVKQRLSGSVATLLTHYRGLSVTELAELRATLREANADYRVIKNTLTRRAVTDAGMEGLVEYLEGPTAMVFCNEDPVAPAKALKAFAKDHPELVIRGGYLDGEVLDETAAIKLADLASREELLAQLAGLMYGSLANTARLLNALPQTQAQLFAALIEDGGNPGVAESAAPAAEAATEDTSGDEAPAEAAEEAPSDGDAAEASTDGDADATPAADAPAAEAADDAPAEAGDDAQA